MTRLKLDMSSLWLSVSPCEHKKCHSRAAPLWRGGDSVKSGQNKRHRIDETLFSGIYNITAELHSNYEEINTIH
jgi:hypothetical protein